MIAQPIAGPQIRGAHDHLTAELRRLDLLLHRLLLRARAAGLVTEDVFRGLTLSDDQVDSPLASQSSGPNAHSARKLAEAAARRRAQIDQHPDCHQVDMKTTVASGWVYRDLWT
jgi:hypothetical protein